MNSDACTSPTPLAAQLEQFRQDLGLQRQVKQQFLEQQKEKDRTIQSLEHQLQQLLRRLYGRSSEKIDPNQQLLFAELLQQLQTQQPLEPAPLPQRRRHSLSA